MDEPKLKRHISLNIYLAALIGTIIVFGVGIYAGMLIDQSAKDSVSGELKSLESDLYLSRIMLLMEENSTQFCPIYSEKLNSVDSERELIGDRLEYLETVRGLEDAELKESYFYLEFENYLLAEKMKKECGEKYVDVIFFYEKGSADSDAQGAELLKLRQANPNVKVFSFDGNSDSAVVKVLKGMYGVTQYPTVVIDGTKISGFQSVDALTKRVG